MAQSNIVQIIIKAKDLAGGVIRKAKAEVAGLGTTAGKVTGAVKGMTGAMAGLGLAIGTATVSRWLFQVNKETGKLVAQLKTLEGTQTGAMAVFRQLSDFAQKTPFQVDELTEAYIKLRTAGIQPTDEMMTSFGDLASARGKSITDLAAAVEDAVVGEMERLKEFGVTAQQSGDQVAFTFNGVTKTVGRNAKEITEYLESVGQSDMMKGGMKNQMETLEGATSNLMDALDGLARGIGDDGLTGMLVHAIGGLTNFVTEIQTAGTATHAAFKGWIDLFRGIGKVLGWLLGIVGKVVGAIVGAIGFAVLAVEDLAATTTAFFLKIPAYLMQGYAAALSVLRSFIEGTRELLLRVGIDVGSDTLDKLDAKIQELRDAAAARKAPIDASLAATRRDIFGFNDDKSKLPRNWGSGGPTTDKSIGGPGSGKKGKESDPDQDQIGILTKASELGLLNPADLADAQALQDRLVAALAKATDLKTRTDLQAKIKDLSDVLIDPNKAKANAEAAADAAEKAFSERLQALEQGATSASGSLLSEAETAELRRYADVFKKQLTAGNLTLEQRLEVTERLKAAQDALAAAGDGGFLAGFAQAIKESVGETETLNRVIANLTSDTIQAFGAAVKDAFAAVVDGSKSAGQAFAGAMLGALGSVASGFGDFFMAKAIAAFADGILGDPRGLVAGAEYTAAATAMYALSGALAGAANRIGGGRGGEAKRANQVSDSQKEATLVIEGGLLDMSDPRQAESLARALSNLSGRRVTVKGRNK